MITCSIIKKSQLEGAIRLDAEYYRPEYLASQKRLMSFKTSPLSSLCKVTDGNHSSISECFTESGVRYLRGQDLTDFFISESTPIYIPEEVYNKLRRSHIFHEDVLVSIVGTIGLVSIAAKHFDKLTANCKIAILHTQKIDSWYLAIFLASMYGQNQIRRKVAGAVQTGIILKDLAGISIPVFTENEQAKIREIAIKAYENQINSEALYSRAEDLLLEELGLHNFKLVEELSYIVNLSAVKSAHRTDAEYFQPKYGKLIEKIKRQKIEMKTLGEITTFLNHTQQPPYIEGGDVPIITQKHLGQAFINLEALNDLDTKHTSNEWINKYSAYRLKQGDILYYSVGAYIGKANIFLEDLNATAASFITIIRAKEELDPTYLMVVINSVVGKLQSDKWQSATAQQYIYPKDIKNFEIPILSKRIQEQISDLVRESQQVGKNAKELLENAKGEVEELIKKT